MLQVLGAIEYMPFVDSSRERESAAIPEDKGRVGMPVPRRITKHGSGGGCGRECGGD